MRDEGVGVHLLEAARVARDWDDSIRFVDGGAGGLNLLNVIERSRRMVVFDAADMGLPAGEYRVIPPEKIVDEPLEHRISMHDVPFTETLELCRRFFRAPDELSIFIVQPKIIDFGRELSEELDAAFEKILHAAVELIEQVHSTNS